MQGMVCKGLVIRQTDYAEADRIITIFTEELGIIHAIAKGARKFGSHQGAAARFLCFGQFTLFSGKNMYTLRGAVQIENFYGLGASVEKLALAYYLCELAQIFAAEANPEPEILKLLLNTLYILENKNRPLLLIKTVYDLRLSALAGFEAQTESCIRCKKPCCLTHFSATEGGTVCTLCAPHTEQAKEISNAARTALTYILCQPSKRIFAFHISEAVLLELSCLAENFVLMRAEKEPNSLSYFKSLV